MSTTSDESNELNELIDCKVNALNKRFKFSKFINSDTTPAKNVVSAEELYSNYKEQFTDEAVRKLNLPDNDPTVGLRFLQSFQEVVKEFPISEHFKTIKTSIDSDTSSEYTSEYTDYTDDDYTSDDEPTLQNGGVKRSEKFGTFSKISDNVVRTRLQNESAKEYLSRIYNFEPVPDNDMKIIADYTKYDNGDNNDTPQIAKLIADSIVSQVSSKLDNIKEERKIIAAMYKLPDEVMTFNKDNSDTQITQDYYELGLRLESNFRDNLEEYKMEKIADLLDNVDPELIPVLGPALNESLKVLDTWNIFKWIGNIFKSLFNAIVNAFKKIINFIYNVLKGFWNLIKDILEKAVNIIIDFILTPISIVLNILAGAFSSALAVLGQGVKFVIDAVFSVIKIALNFIIKILSEACKVILNVILYALQAILEKFATIWPVFAQFYELFKQLFSVEFWLGIIEGCIIMIMMLCVIYGTYIVTSTIYTIQPNAVDASRSYAT